MPADGSHSISIALISSCLISTVRDLRRRLPDGRHLRRSGLIAGHLKLSNLCWIYDNNQITIEGKTSLAYSDDVKTRFEGYGWDVTHVTDANDATHLPRRFASFRTPRSPDHDHRRQPYRVGSPHRQDTKEAHGEALGEEEVRLTKKFYGWPEDAKFLVPDGVKERFQELMGKRGRTLRDQWTSMFAEYKKKYPDLADALDRMEHRQLPDGWDKDLPTFPADAKGLATRDSGGKVLNQLAKNTPWLVGGSADSTLQPRLYLPSMGRPV